MGYTVGRDNISKEQEKERDTEASPTLEGSEASRLLVSFWFYYFLTWLGGKDAGVKWELPGGGGTGTPLIRVQVGALREASWGPI